MKYKNRFFKLSKASHFFKTTVRSQIFRFFISIQTICISNEISFVYRIFTILLPILISFATLFIGCIAVECKKKMAMSTHQR